MMHDDSWKFDVAASTKYPVPSFIRLLVIARVLQPVVTNATSSTSPENTNTIQNLVSVFTNDENRKVAFNILVRLTSGGLQLYMSNHFNEERDSPVIEQIFTKIVLTKFCQEYQRLITYIPTHLNSNDKCDETLKTNTTKINQCYHCQSMVFNTRDLMCLMLQFLDCGDKLDGDLYQCSLVCSYWLYLSWNPNSIYHICLDHFAENTIAKDQSHRVTKHWQRIINAKSLLLQMGWRQRGAVVTDMECLGEMENLLLSKILMLGQIEKICIQYIPQTINILTAKVVLSNCRNKIKQLNLNNFNTFMRSKLPPLKLFNLESIVITDFDFRLIWSNKCKKLRLSSCNRIIDEDCSFIIENCDCTGITYLDLQGISFYKSSFPLVSKLAQKFTNITHLNILLQYDNTRSIYLLWRDLQVLINKNKGYVELETSNYFPDDELQNLQDFIVKNNVKIKTTSSTLKSQLQVDLMFPMI